MAFDPALTVDDVQPAFVGKFAVEATVAAGGQGAVFKARNLDGAAAVQGIALKVYFADQVEERTAREIAALRAIKGETLVELVGEGRCDVRGAACFYIATTFIEGEPLSDVVASGPLAPELVAQVGHDIALAIQSLWASRIVHRDIKPNNIMLSATGRAVLIDLGLARHLALVTLTTPGKTWGTEGYLSPEHARGLALTCKSDVFALGIVMQECLLGRHPTGRRQAQLLQGGPRTGGLRAGLPPPLVALIDAMVHVNPVYRPLPGALARALAPLLPARP